MDGSAPALGVNRAAEPKFHFLEINTSQLSGLEPHITVDSRIQVVKVNKQVLRYADKGISMKELDDFIPFKAGMSIHPKKRIRIAWDSSNI